MRYSSATQVGFTIQRLFGGDENLGIEADEALLVATMQNNYPLMLGLLRRYETRTFTAQEVNQGLRSGAGQNILAWKVQQVLEAPDLIAWCEKQMGTGGPLCVTCGTSMQPAGSAFVCEGCGAVQEVKSPDDPDDPGNRGGDPGESGGGPAGDRSGPAGPVPGAPTAAGIPIA